jgi:hypothetical protein
MKMSAEDGLLKHLSRLSADAMSNHHQRHTETINGCITLPLKAEGRALDNSDCLIEELIDIKPKEALLCNETVDNCCSENVLKMNAVSLNSTESSYVSRHKADFLGDRETNVAFLDASYSTPQDTHLQSGPLDLQSSSEPLDISSNKLQNTFQALNGTDRPSPPTESSDSVTQIGMERPDPNQTSQSAQNVPTHTRSLSQTTSQLRNLKESINSDNLVRISLVNNLLQGFHVKKLSDSHAVNKSITSYPKNVPAVSQISSPNEEEPLTSQDVTSSTGLDMAPDNADLKEETTFECSPYPSQCSGTVSYLSNLECDVESHLTDSLYPGWKLDRRESGHLYWRRDSSTLNGVDPTNRVKFRYHIEVREFESRSSETEDLSEGDDDDNDDSDEEVKEAGKYSISNSVGSAAIIGGVIAVIVMAYRWLLGSLAVI